LGLGEWIYSSKEVNDWGGNPPIFIRLNSLMNKKASVFPNMVTYVPIRRKDWILKISIWKDKSILVVCYNVFTLSTVVRNFENADLAASFLDFLVEQEEI
jgi:hypothetical protein